MSGEALTKVVQLGLDKLEIEAMSVAIATWSDAMTDASSRRRDDLLWDKSRAMVDFFTSLTGSPTDVQEVLVHQDANTTRIYLEKGWDQAGSA
jgi:hypothetical protein